LRSGTFWQKSVYVPGRTALGLGPGAGANFIRRVIAHQLLSVRTVWRGTKFDEPDIFRILRGHAEFSERPSTVISTWSSSER
jgi:hypothetical protein